METLFPGQIYGQLLQGQLDIPSRETWPAEVPAVGWSADFKSSLKVSRLISAKSLNLL